MVSNLQRFYIHFIQAGTFTVTVTDPVSGATVTDASPTVTWSISSGTQQAYRVLIYADALGATVVYDSGWTANPIGSHTIPAGILSTGQTYYIQVQVSTTLGAGGDSSITDFDTDFATSVDVTGLRLYQLGVLCADPASIPHVRVTWDIVVPGVGESFSFYYVKRKGENDSDWTVLAQIDNINTHSWVDYTPGSYNTYRYAVIWEALTGGGTLISSEQTGSDVYSRLEYEYAWLHVTASPTTYMRVQALDYEEAQEFEMEMENVWGTNAPVPTFGEQDYRTVGVSILPDVFASKKWDELLDLIRASRDQNSVLCYRHGASKTKMFCQIRAPGRQLSVKDFTSKFDLVETPYEENVI